MVGAAALAAGVVGRVRAQAVPYGFAQVDLDVRIRPIPIRADGKLHLRCELYATNFQSGPIELVRLEVLAGDEGDRVVRRFGAPAPNKLMLQLGAPADREETRVALLPDLNHYAFITDESQVVREMREFLEK